MTEQTKLSPAQIEILNKLAPLINEYLIETKLQTTLQSFLRELVFMQIIIDNQLMGFWGGCFREAGQTRLMTIKAFYLQPQFRGKYRNQAADNLVAMLEQQGVTHLEVWNSPVVQEWFQQRYKMEPTIYVTFNTLSAYKIKE